MLEKIVFSVALVSLGIAAISDLKTREVPDWLSYSTIGFGIGLRLLATLITLDWSFIITGILGLLVFLALALLMFYTGQWGGGDSKLLIGIGVLLGFEPTFSKIPILFIFWMNALLIGAFYGLLFSLFLAFRHKKRFIKHYKRLYLKYKKLRYILLASSVLSAIIAFFVQEFFLKLTLVIFALFLLAMIYILLFVKAIENAAMKKLVEVEVLTIGDWIVDDVKIEGKYICGPKDLGIDEKQIKTLIKLKNQGKIRKILIKEGIPFVPGFFFAMIATILFGNWFVWLV